MRDVGEQLKEARRGRGYSLEEVHYETRIPVAHLRRLESNEYSDFSGKQNAKFYLKNYADFLGVELNESAVSELDEKELSLNELFLSQQKPSLRGQGMVQGRRGNQSVRDEKVSKRTSREALAWLMTGAVATLCLLGIIGGILGGIPGYFLKDSPWFSGKPSLDKKIVDRAVVPPALVTALEESLPIPQRKVMEKKLPELSHKDRIQAAIQKVVSSRAAVDFPQSDTDEVLDQSALVAELDRDDELDVITKSRLGKLANPMQRAMYYELFSSPEAQPPLSNELKHPNPLFQGRAVPGLTSPISSAPINSSSSSKLPFDQTNIDQTNFEQTNSDQSSSNQSNSNQWRGLLPSSGGS